MIQRMLDAHPDLAMCDESYFPVVHYRERERYERPDGLDLDLLARDLLDNEEYPYFRRYWGHMDPDRVRAVLQGVEPISFADAMRRLYALHAEANAKARYGDKTPAFVRSIDVLSSLFPEARFVHIIRDGRDVARSLNEVHFGPGTVVGGAYQWVRGVRKGVRDGRTLGGDRYLEVRYEELAIDPEPGLRRICDLFELDFIPEMLGPFRERLRRPPRRIRQRAHDPERHLRDWRREMTTWERALVDIVAGPLLSELGYERTWGDSLPAQAATDISHPDRSPRVVFVHIPKTAGTTMRTVLTRQYGMEGCFNVDGYHLLESAERFHRLSPEGQTRIRAFRGHMPFGLHQVIPGPVTYITFLRDPVDRIVSHYYYSLRKQGAPFHQEIVSNGFSLEDYVLHSSAAPLFNNGQTRLLGSSFRDDPHPATRETLETALRNIEEHFTVVGLVERFDESLLLMRRALGWRWPAYIPVQVTPERPSREAVPRSTRELIADRNRLDIELYRFAAQNLDARVAERGLRGRAEVWALGMVNRLWRRRRAVVG